ncbi:hypothetical protein [Acinetobacter soli]|uniref:hypothetical protein n=1 Tax=Acinetobacter soli TaxID=487316 RepID=UPI00125F4222|nr:hypothetical protein [Acinetobacter soli]
MNYNGIFIDDNNDDKAKYSQILNYLPYEKTKISVDGVSPKQIMDVVAEILEKRPDIVFLDFRLDEDLVSNGLNVNQSYKGGGLAQILREKVTEVNKKYQDFPIVLVSSENNLENLYDPEKTTHDLFDSCYKKEKLAIKSEHLKLSRKLVSLIEGYKFLNEKFDNLDVFELFGLENNEENGDILDQQEIKLPLSSSEIPHVRSKFILKYILRRESILISRHEVAARLGATPESLDSILWGSIEKCRYDGIFSEGWERWWAHLFEDFLVENVGFRPYSMTSKERVEALNSKIGSELLPAKSRWNNSEDEKSVFACTFCRKPTELRHSLSVYDSLAPKFTQKKRICFRCIKEENYEKKKIIIDDSDKKFLDNILHSNI